MITLNGSGLKVTKWNFSAVKKVLEYYGLKDVKGEERKGREFLLTFTIPERTEDKKNLFNPVGRWVQVVYDRTVGFALKMCGSGLMTPFGGHYIHAELCECEAFMGLLNLAMQHIEGADEVNALT
jgi:hypothetical protein